MLVVCELGRNWQLSGKKGLINSDQILRVLLQTENYVVSPITSDGIKYYATILAGEAWCEYNFYLNENIVKSLMMNNNQAK